MSRCTACGEGLYFRPDDDEDAGHAADAVPDDLELRCGCHYHWQCLLDESSEITISLKCPGCESFLPTNQAGPSISSSSSMPSPGTAILVQYTNEGGVQSDLDILPDLTEEAYLASHPEARPARAFQVMCSEGDVDGIIELLSAMQGIEDERIDTTSVLGYQDPLSNMKSGLHLAVEREQVEVALLLLWLCSTVPRNAFPEAASQTAEMNGVHRLPVGPDGDIRVLRDSNGLTAEHIARQLQGPWLEFLDAGLLAP